MWLLSLGFRIVGSYCKANLVFVGTLSSSEGYYLRPPGADHQHPQGSLSTRYTFTVDRLVLDLTGQGADGRVEVSLPGGRMGDRVQSVPEMPDIEVGDRYAFAVNWLPGRPHLLVLGWSELPPERELPSLAQLQGLWARSCSLP
jgi:hypothetical protein